MRFYRLAVIGLVLATLAVGAGAVEIHGNVITDFREGQRQMDNAGWQSTTQNGQFRLTTVSLIATTTSTTTCARWCGPPTSAAAP